MSTSYGEKEYREWLADPVFKPAPPVLFPVDISLFEAAQNYNVQSDGDDGFDFVDDESFNDTDTTKERDNEQPCSRNTYLGKFHRPRNYPLPQANCFNGTGFGLWDDPFNSNYNLDDAQNWIQRRMWADQWIALGVRYVQPGAQWDASDLIQMWKDARRENNVPIEIVLNSSGHDRKNRSRNIDLGKTFWNYIKAPQLFKSKLLNDSRVLIDYAYFNDTGPDIYLDEPESHGVGSVYAWDSFLSGLRVLLYGNGNKCIIKVNIGSYDLNVIQMIMSNFANEVRNNCITILPEQYYNFIPYRSRFDFWKKIADSAINNGINTNMIRPYISPVCDFCGSGYVEQAVRSTDPCCNPEFLVFDILQIMELELAGPSIYMGNGMSSEFFDYLVLSAWLAGCIESGGPFDPPFEKRPTNYGELYDLLDMISARPELIAQLKSNFSANDKRFNGEIYENPGSCTRSCFRVIDEQGGFPRSELYNIGPCCDLPQCKNQNTTRCAVDSNNNPIIKPSCI